MHINNAYKEGELDKTSTCKESLQVQIEGTRRVVRKVKYYDLDVIISVGYRVKSKRGPWKALVCHYENAGYKGRPDTKPYFTNWGVK